MRSGEPLERESRRDLRPPRVRAIRESTGRVTVTKAGGLFNNARSSDVGSGIDRRIADGVEDIEGFKTQRYSRPFPRPSEVLGQAGIHPVHRVDPYSRL